MHSSDPLTPFLGLRARVRDLQIADVEQELLVARSLWRPARLAPDPVDRDEDGRTGGSGRRQR
ncbi:MAG: hypothetical protein ACR2HR_17135 [Euzebya sp.]